MATTFRARIVNGKPSFPVRFAGWCETHEGAYIRIEHEEALRSLSQNAMFHAWLDQVADDTGNDPVALKDFLIEKCAPRHVVTIKGRDGRQVEVEQITRTSAMTKAEMGEFMERCAALTGSPLPTKEALEQMGYISNY